VKDSHLDHQQVLRQGSQAVSTNRWRGAVEGGSINLFPPSRIFWWDHRAFLHVGYHIFGYPICLYPLFGQGVYVGMFNNYWVILALRMASSVPEINACPTAAKCRKCPQNFWGGFRHFFVMLSVYLR
jgi:hypothetical protein